MSSQKITLYNWFIMNNSLVSDHAPQNLGLVSHYVRPAFKIIMHTAHPSQLWGALINVQFGVSTISGEGTHMMKRGEAVSTFPHI